MFIKLQNVIKQVKSYLTYQIKRMKARIKAAFFVFIVIYLVLILVNTVSANEFLSLILYPYCTILRLFDVVFPMDLISTEIETLISFIKTEGQIQISKITAIIYLDPEQI